MWKRDELMAYFSLGLKLNIRLVFVLDQHHPLSMRMIQHSYVETWNPIEHAIFAASARTVGCPIDYAVTRFTPKGWKIRIRAFKQNEDAHVKWYPQTILKPVVKSKKRTSRGTVRSTIYLKGRDDLIRWIGTS